MVSDFAGKLAHVITEYATPIHEGDTVLISTSVLGIPAAQAVLRAVLKRGGNPVYDLWSSELAETRLLEGNEQQLARANPVLQRGFDVADVYIMIVAQENVLMRGDISEGRLAAARKGWYATQAKLFDRVSSDPEYRWLNTIWPTQAHAQDAQMGLVSYTAYVYKALGLDHDDPVAYWEELKIQQERLIAWCAGKRRVEIKGPDVDLSFDITGRPWANYHGKHHLPDGEIFTCPIEDSVNGTIAFNRSTFTIDGAHLTFEDGMVTEASARQDEERLNGILNTDEGARRIGLFGIGTNPGITQFTRGSMFDLKMLGTVHVLLGQSMADGGGRNESEVQVALLHDMRDGSEIWLDGELFYQNGRFVVG